MKAGDDVSINIDALDAHRRDIDRIDRTIVALLSERMRIGMAVGELKTAAAEPMRSPAREATVLARVRDAAAGPLSPASAERIFTAIIEETAAVQIADAAYQGAPGAFSEEAVAALLGTDARALPCRTLADVFHAVATGAARSAVVPVFNSIAGAVPDCTSLIEKYGLTVLAERPLLIVQCLIGLPGTAIDDVRSVSSHPVALAQCSRFLESHPKMAPVAAFDTAGSVEEIVRMGRPERAAIASRRAAATWGAAVLAEGIQDRKDNLTTFVLVSTSSTL